MPQAKTEVARQLSESCVATSALSAMRMPFYPKLCCSKRQLLARPICRNVSEDFCCVNFGGFSRRFSWRIFLGTVSHKNEEKKSSDRIRKKIRRLKNRNREKSILPSTGPNNCIATLRKLRCTKVALSCCFPADFRLPRLGPAETHINRPLRHPVLLHRPFEWKLA